MYEIMVSSQFSGAHALRMYRGKCERMHGHNWKIEVYARGRKLDDTELLLDFKELKAATNQVIEYLDNKVLNEIKPFDKELNPSAENLARYIFEQVSKLINSPQAEVYKVRVFETPTSAATYQK